MKKSLVLVLLLSSMALLLIAGCSSTAAPATQSNHQEPIIGLWRISGGESDIRYQFNSDGTFQNTWNGGADIGSGTWVLKGYMDSGDTAYIVNFNGGPETFVYSKKKNAIYETASPGILYTPYQGHLGLTTPVQQTPIPTTTPITPPTRTTSHSSTDGDQAAVAKMTEMVTWMQPTMEMIGDSATSGDYLKMGLNAALLRSYIDNNLPEMRRLANSATTKKAGALEFVACLEDLRTSTDLIVQAVDEYNAGYINQATDLLLEANTYTVKGSAHLKTAVALM